MVHWSLSLGVGAVVGAAYGLYYRTQCVAVPTIFTKDHARDLERIISECKTLREEYWPTFWATNGHVQTILSTFRWKVPTQYHRELLRLQDGGTIAMDWIPHTNTKPQHVKGVPTPIPLDQPPDLSGDTKPILLILHGVTGGAFESYVTHLASQGHSLGWHCVVHNQRGCGGSVLTSPRGYCAAVSGDLEEVVRHIALTHKSHELYAVGVSMGANVLVKYLGEAGNRAHIRAAISLANPLDTLASGKRLNSGIAGLLYSPSLAKRLRAYVDRHRDMLGKIIDLSEVEKCKTVWEVDAKLTVPAFGYRDVLDYYTQAASLNVLHQVCVPLLCLNAEDDALAPAASYLADHASRQVCMVGTKHGGHVAWWEGIIPWGRNWSDRVVVEFLWNAHKILHESGHYEPQQSLPPSPDSATHAHG